MGAPPMHSSMLKSKIPLSPLLNFKKKIFPCSQHNQLTVRGNLQILQWLRRRQKQNELPSEILGQFFSNCSLDFLLGFYLLIICAFRYARRTELVSRQFLRPRQIFVAGVVSHHIRNYFCVSQRKPRVGCGVTRIAHVRFPGWRSQKRTN